MSHKALQKRHHKSHFSFIRTFIKLLSITMIIMGIICVLPLFGYQFDFLPQEIVYYFCGFAAILGGIRFFFGGNHDHSKLHYMIEKYV